MRHAARLVPGFFAFTLLVAQLSCGDSSGPGLVAASISANSSTTQSAAPGTAVADPPSVIVLDQNGEPLAGATVIFTVTSGGGSVTGGSATTSATGVATVGSWTLGTVDGATNTLAASSGSLTPVTFTANGADPCVVSSTHTLGTTTNGELTVSDCAFSDGSFVDLIGTTLAGAGTYVFNQSSTVFDTYLLLYTQDGPVIGLNDDLAVGFSDSRVKAILPAGNYVVAANSYAGKVTGAYTISSSTDATPVTNCEDVFVVRGTTTTQSLQSTDCARSGFYADDYLIFLLAGQTITVSMNSSTVDSYLALYVPGSGSRIAQNDDKDGTTKDAQIIFTASFDGFYAISATSGGAGVTGEYTVIIQ